MPICGRGCMFAENPSPLPDATTDAMVDLRHFHSLQSGKGRKQEERVTVCFQAQFLVTFRLSTERNVTRLVGAAAAAQVQLLKTMGLGRLTCEGYGVAVWSRPPAAVSGKCSSFGFDGVDLG